MTKTDFRAISYFIGDCWKYFEDVLSIASDAYLVYQLLSLADSICSKHSD